MAVVRIDLEINDKGEATIRKTSASMRDLGDQAKGTKGVMDSLFAGLGQGAGQKIFAELQSAAKAFAVAVIDSTVELAKFGSHLADLSAKSGASTQSLQKLGFAGSLVGVSLDEISAALPKMQRGLVEGNKAFGQLGLSIDQLRKMDPDQQFAAIAATIGQIVDPAEQSAAAIAIFGKSGASLLPLMKSDISAVTAEAERLGIVLDKDTIKAADDLDDALTVLDQTWLGLKNQLASIIVQNPEVVNSINLVKNAIGGLSRVIQDNHEWFDNFLAIYRKIAEIASGGFGFQLVGNLAKKGIAALAAQAPEEMPEWQMGRVGPPPRFRGKGGGSGAGDSKSAARDALEFERGMARANNEEMRRVAEEKKRLAAEYVDILVETGKLEQKQYKDVLAQLQFKDQMMLADLKERQRQEEEAKAKRAAGIQADADAMRALGAAVGGVFGTGIDAAGSIIEKFRMVKNQTDVNLTATQKWATALQGVMSIIQNGPAGKAKGAMSGAATGAAVGTAILPGWGTAVGAVVGGIVGFFSGGAKKRKQEQEAALQAAQKAAEEKARLRTEGVGLMETGLVAGIKGLGTPTLAAAQSQATLLAATFWTTFKEKGLLGAIDAFKDTFAQLTTSGFDVSAALGAVGTVMAAGVNEGFRAAAEGAQGFRDMLHGFIEADIPLTVEQFSALGQQAQQAMDQARAGATEAGLSVEDANKAALAAISPLLQEILVGSQKYGIVIDANTQALIDQAKAAGLAFPTDPMTKMVDLLGQIVLLLGGAIPAAAGAAGAAIAGIVTGGPAGRAAGGLLESPEPLMAAKGYGPIIVPNMGRGRGPLIQTHAGEGVLIVPRAHVGRMPGVFGAARGFGFSRDAGGDFAGGGGGRGIGTGGGFGGGGTTTSVGDVTFTAGGGARRAAVAADAAVQDLTEQITQLKAVVEKAASAPPISIVSTTPISVEQNPMKVRESAVEAGEFVTNQIVRQLQRRDADLVAAIREIQREGR